MNSEGSGDLELLEGEECCSPTDQQTFYGWYWDVLVEIELYDSEAKDGAVQSALTRVYIDDSDLLKASQKQKWQIGRLSAKVVKAAIEQGLFELCPSQVTAVAEATRHISNIVFGEVTTESIKYIAGSTISHLIELENQRQLHEAGLPVRFGSSGIGGQRRKRQDFVVMEEASTSAPVDNGTTVFELLGQFWSLVGEELQDLILKLISRTWTAEENDRLRRKLKRVCLGSLKRTEVIMDELHRFVESASAGEEERRSAVAELMFSVVSAVSESDTEEQEDSSTLISGVLASALNVFVSEMGNSKKDETTSAERSVEQRRKRLKRIRSAVAKFGFVFGDAESKGNGGADDEGAGAYEDGSLKFASKNADYNLRLRQLEKSRKISAELHDSNVLLESEAAAFDFSFDEQRDKNLLAKNFPYKADNDVMRYWWQRYRLFSKFDQGVAMDREGWFSVTPERIAEHVAERFRGCSIIVDAFCGVGGNSIQFAKVADFVIAIDMDPVRLKCARRNAEVYNVADRIMFVLADFFAVSRKLQADAVYLSPPWGGPAYSELETYNLETDMAPLNGIDVFAAAREISPNIGYFVPRNTDVKQLIKLAGKGNRCEIEQSMLNDKLKAITVYYGDLCSDDAQ